MSAKPSKRDARILRDWAAGVPMAKICARTGLTQQRISQIVRKYGGKPRSARPRPPSPESKLIDSCRTEIEAEIANGKSVNEVARELGLADKTLHKNGVSNPGYWTSDAEKREWERLYLDEGMSTSRIARHTGAPQSTITLHLKKRGLTRDPQVAARAAYSDKRRETLSQLCVRLSKEGVPEDEIARRCKTISVEGVRAHLRRDAEKRRWEQMYVAQNLTAAEIAKLTGECEATISVHIKRAGLSRPQGRRRIW